MAYNLKVADTDKIIEHLNELSTKTEEIYLKLGRALPLLFKEIEGGMNSANHLIRVFSTKNDSSCCLEEENPIQNSIEKAELLVEDTSNFFIALERRDKKLFAAINNSINCLEDLEDQFSDIREDSIDMEIVSLNAKVAAIKAGKHSEGFAYISDELRKLSATTAKSTDLLAKRGDTVLQNLKSFTGKIENIQHIQQNFYNHFRDNLKHIFESYNQKVDGLIKHLGSAINEAESVKGPLNNIMEIIQIQDIIRQSLEHVELVLKETDQNIMPESPDQFLDNLSFIETLYKLCSDLLHDISIKIAESINTFSINIDKLRDILNKVDKGQDSADPEEDLSNIVNNSMKTLESLLKNLEKSMKVKSRIPLDAKKIVKTLIHLEEGFMASLIIVSRFYPININARMEAAKWDAFNQFGIATEEMSSAIHKINCDMETALQLIRKITREIDTSITLYTKENKEELIAIDDITGRIMECFKGLTGSSKLLSDTLHSFSLYSNSFFSLLDSTELDIAELKKLIDLINNIRETLRNSGEAVSIMKNKTLSENGFESWEVKDSKLEEIISKFTIYTHKQTAENIAGINNIKMVEAGEAGELTLF